MAAPRLSVDESQLVTALSPDGSLAALAGPRGISIHRVEPAGLAGATVLLECSVGYREGLFAANAPVFVACSSWTEIAVWDMISARKTTIDLTTAPTSIPGYVLFLDSVSVDGTIAIVRRGKLNINGAASAECAWRVTVYDTVSGTCVLQAEADHCAMSRDKHLAVWTTRHKCVVADIATTRVLWIGTMGGVSEHPCLFSPDGSQVATRSGNTIRLWDTLTGAVAMVIELGLRTDIYCSKYMDWLWPHCTPSAICIVAVAGPDWHNGGRVGTFRTRVIVVDTQTGHHISSSHWDLAPAGYHVRMLAASRNITDIVAVFTKQLRGAKAVHRAACTTTRVLLLILCTRRRITAHADGRCGIRCVPPEVWAGLCGIWK